MATRLRREAGCTICPVKGAAGWVVVHRVVWVDPSSSPPVHDQRGTVPSFFCGKASLCVELTASLHRPHGSDDGGRRSHDWSSTRTADPDRGRSTRKGAMIDLLTHSSAMTRTTRAASVLSPSCDNDRTQQSNDRVQHTSTRWAGTCDGSCS
jgi:hypothetical protein